MGYSLLPTAADSYPKRTRIRSALAERFAGGRWVVVSCWRLVVVAAFAALSVFAGATSWAASYAQPHPAVVRVVAPERDGMSLGSGSLVAVNDSFGLVITNWHVVRDAAGQVGVIFPNGFRSAATVARTDRDWDLAALIVWRPNVAPIPLASQSPQPGDTLTIAGYGSGPYRAVSGRCTEYLSPGQNLPYEMVELDVAARQGDSGGPIFNSRGELAGVLFGSGFGRTTGSYCGRVRWFLALVDGDFQRLSLQMAAARQPAAPRDPAPLVAISSGQTAAGGVAVSPSPAPTTLSTPPRPQPVAAPVAHAGRAAPSVSCSVEVPKPTLVPASAPPRSVTVSLPTMDSVKTVLAVVGAIALLYASLRLLGRAVG
ncbi:MAG: trypsin-like peptidase domain-containing protein [Thermoguttaceae bacterium]